MSQEAWDGFIQEHAKILKTPDSTPTLNPSSSVPKQYGSVSQIHQANASTIEPQDTTEVVVDSDTSSDDEETLETVQEMAHLHYTGYMSTVCTVARHD